MTRFLARCAAWCYHRIVKLWHASYRRFPNRIQKVDAKVVSIGNITWGGTGKTPLTIYIARSLSEEGQKVAVLTRGYGQDEVQELQKNLPGVPVIVGRDRVRSAREAVEKHGAQVLLMDDGFQHLRLHRNVDLVMLNSTEPFGPGGLIPLGTLREPLESLARADMFVLTKCDVGSKNVHWIRQKLNSLKPNAVIFEAIHRPVRLRDPLRNRVMRPEDLRGRKVSAISGIGDPYSFEKTIELLDAEIVFSARYEDHHRFSDAEVAYFVKQARGMGLKDAITTEKDFVRLEPILRKKEGQSSQGFTFWVLEIEVQVNDEEDLIRRCLHS